MRETEIARSVMTADHPLLWIARHVQGGIKLREAVYSLQTSEEAGEWELRAKVWRQEAVTGVGAWRPSDVPRVETDGDLIVMDLRIGHLWYETPIYGIAVSSTAEGRPFNNPANRHATCVKHLGEIASEWRADPPTGMKSSEPINNLASKSSQAVPEGADAESVKVDPYRTGGQGRPTVSHFVKNEFELRIAGNLVEPTIAAEARALQRWVEKQHPDGPPLTARTIENQIRRRYQGLPKNTTK